MSNFMGWYNDNNIADEVIKEVDSGYKIGIVILLKRAYDAGCEEGNNAAEDVITGLQEQIVMGE